MDDSRPINIYLGGPASVPTAPPPFARLIHELIAYRDRIVKLSKIYGEGAANSAYLDGAVGVYEDVAIVLDTILSDYQEEVDG